MFLLFLNYCIFTSMEISDFFNSIREGNLERTAALLEAHPELLTSRDQRGSTPLILAGYYNQGEVVRLLLEKGVPVDEKDSSGNTALMGACFKGYTGIAEILIDAGANVNARNGMGGTCLIFAITFNREPMARLLVEKGARVDAKDPGGKTALDHAKSQGLHSLIPILEAQS
ncbi:ankyrin repeat domain-containing protein [Robiginitalea sp.]|uniref:ankyrin repeat domain-containing protein n=1 Tax=Robiginitalea sp. TaxID=1902411 RepID=UPI003C754EDE